MRKIILQEWLTIDGFAADRNNELGFFEKKPGLNKYSDDDILQFMETIDTILLGRKTYELFVNFWPKATTDQEVIADKLNSTPKIVFSSTLTQAPWGKWPDAGIIKTDPLEAIRKLKSQTGKHMVLWGSLTLAQSLIKENLIDEYHLRICPTALGEGRSLFPKDINELDLELFDVKKYNSGLMLLQYRNK